MTKNKFSIPAYLSDFKEEETNRTIAKLKVFYKGETGDGRIFTDEFAEQVATTIPYAPVVAFYDEEKEDFVGHNHTQYIYGLVRGDAEVGFEKGEDGNEWLVSEVMLYTDRVDNIGEVAKKIVGQPHSLELDPNTVKYEFVKVNGKRKLKFLEGNLVGLSVLGTNEQPAFTGSEFFKVGDDLKAKFDMFIAHLTEKKERGMTMNPNLETIQKYAEFLSLSYTQKMQAAYDILLERYKDSAVTVYVCEMADDRVVYEVYDWNDDTLKTYRDAVEVADNTVTLSNTPVEVIKTYATQEELDAIAVSAAAANAEADGDGEEEEVGEPADASNGNEDEGADNGGQEEEGQEEEEDANAALSDTPTPLLDAERTELEELRAAATEAAALVEELTTYRKQAKEALIESYKGHLAEDVLAGYDVDKYSVQDLTVTLALAYSEQRAIPKFKTPLAFKVEGNNNNSGQRDVNALIAEYKNKTV